MRIETDGGITFEVEPFDAEDRQLLQRVSDFGLRLVAVHRLSWTPPNNVFESKLWRGPSGKDGRWKLDGKPFRPLLTKRGRPIGGPGGRSESWFRLNLKSRLDLKDEFKKVKRSRIASKDPKRPEDEEWWQVERLEKRLQELREKVCAVVRLERRDEPEHDGQAGVWPTGPEGFAALLCSCKTLRNYPSHEQPMGRGQRSSGTIGRLRWEKDFRDVWVGDAHFNLRSRDLARYCVKVLAQARATSPEKALSFKTINTRTRKMAGKPAQNIDGCRMGDFFKGKVVARLKRDLIGQGEQHDTFYLKTD